MTGYSRNNLNNVQWQSIFENVVLIIEKKQAENESLSPVHLTSD